jgi:hypothetical protein
MTEKEQLTQVTCEEEWEVSMGKKTFLLTPKQVELLKQATTAGKSGIVWFGDLAISIPHINYVALKRKQYYKFISDSLKQLISKSEYDELSNGIVKSE